MDPQIRLKCENQLAIDEGKRLDVYRDTMGGLTVGIGHLIIQRDGLFEGDTISEERCNDLFQNDIDYAIDNCKRIYPAFDGFPVAAQQALVNMMFNIGGRMEQFKHFNNLVNLQCWSDVADFLFDNFKLWYSQVHGRAVRVEQLFRSINGKAV